MAAFPQLDLQAAAAAAAKRPRQTDPALLTGTPAADKMPIAQPARKPTLKYQLHELLMVKVSALLGLVNC
jgi:hypothetical protein